MSMIKSQKWKLIGTEFDQYLAESGFMPPMFDFFSFEE
jgi:hypothetical protein